MHQGTKGKINRSEDYPQKYDSKDYSSSINQLNSGTVHDYVTREIKLPNNSLGVISQVPLTNLTSSSRGAGSPASKPQQYNAVYQPPQQNNNPLYESQSQNLGHEYLNTYDPVMQSGRVGAGMYGPPMTQQPHNAATSGPIQLPNTESPTNKYQPFGNFGVSSGYDRFKGGIGGFYTPQAQQQVQNMFARDGEFSAKTSMANKQPANLSPSNGQFNPIGGFSTLVQKVTRRRTDDDHEDN